MTELTDRIDDYPFHVRDEKLLLSIGRVSVHFSALEHILSIFISSLITMKRGVKAGYMAANELSYRKKLAVLASLYKHRIKEPDKLIAFDSLIEKLQHLEKSRDLYMHSFWDMKPDGTITRVKPKAKLGNGFSSLSTPANPKELNEFSERIISHGKMVMEVWAEFNDQLDHHSENPDEKTQT